MSSHQSTFGLPPEILAHIFRYVARDAWGEPSDLFTSSDPFLEELPECDYRWIHVTHVCQRWRAVALDTADLWARINTRNQDLFSQCLTRSRQYSPLEVGVVVEGSAAGHINMLAPELHRVQKLRLFGYSHAGLQAACDTLSASVSNLTDLNITRPRGGLDHDRFTLPSGHFEGSPLRRLVLCKVSFRLNNPIFASSITHLALFPPDSHDTMRTRDMGTCRELLHVLQRMRGLESLILASVINLPATDLPTCTFTRLRRLCLLATAGECAAFLSHISFPPTAAVALHIRYSWFTVDVPSLAQAVVRCLASPMQSATLATELNGLRFRGALSSVPPAAWDPRPTDSSAMFFPPPYNEDVPIDLVLDGLEQALPVIEAIGRHLPVVRHLRVQPWDFVDDDPASLDAWEGVFASLSITDAQESPPLPTLEILDIRGFEPSHCDLERPWDDVYGWLEQRFRHGIPVRELRVDNCPLSERESVVEEIGQYVGTVVWD